MPFRFWNRRKNLIRVVLADDQPEVRRALKTYLARDGRFEIVGEAEDGEQAVALVGAEKPEALVMDLAMPKMNGLLATEEIARQWPETKIIILSSVAPFAGTRDDALALGAHAVFDKYTHPKKLIRALTDAVGR